MNSLHDEHAYTVNGYWDYSHIFEEEALKKTVQNQWLTDTTFSVEPYRTSFTDTRNGRGHYAVGQEQQITILEESGNCIGFLATLFPTLTFAASPQLITTPPRETDTTSPPKDDDEEERRCKLVRAFPISGGYNTMAIFVSELDKGFEQLEGLGGTVTPERLKTYVSLKHELLTTYIELRSEQHARQTQKKGLPDESE